MVPSRSRLVVGIGAAAMDGILLAFWGISTKYLGNTNPNLLCYALVIFFAGCLYIGLTRISKKQDRQMTGDASLFKYLGLFVFIAVFQFAIGILVFEYTDAEVSISAFLRNSSLIFAALICQFACLYPSFCKQVNLNTRMIAGILIFTFSTWLFVGAPLDKNQWGLAISAWGLLSILIGFNRSITEILTQKFTQVSNTFTMNAVIGASFIGISLLIIVFCILNRQQLPSLIQVILIMLVGGIIPSMQAFRFLSYRHLKEILGKKGIGIWAYLLASFILGIIVFGEKVRFESVVGLFLGLVAVILLEDGLYKSFFKQELAKSKK